MGSVALVVVGLNFRAVGFVGVVHGVVECNHLGVVRAVVVVQVVQTNVKAVNAGVDDGDRHTRPVVSGLLLRQINLVHDGSIAVLNLENTVEFQHDHAG